MNDDPDREDWSLEDVLGVFLDARQDDFLKVGGFDEDYFSYPHTLGL